MALVLHTRSAAPPLRSPPATVEQLVGAAVERGCRGLALFLSGAIAPGCGTEAAPPVQWLLDSGWIDAVVFVVYPYVAQYSAAEAVDRAPSEPVVLEPEETRPLLVGWRDTREVLMRLYCELLARWPQGALDRVCVLGYSLGALMHARLWPEVAQHARATHPAARLCNVMLATAPVLTAAQFAEARVVLSQAGQRRVGRLDTLARLEGPGLSHVIRAARLLECGLDEDPHDADNAALPFTRRSAPEERAAVQGDSSSFLVLAQDDPVAPVEGWWLPGDLWAGPPAPLLDLRSVAGGLAAPRAAVVAAVRAQMETGEFAARCRVAGLKLVWIPGDHLMLVHTREFARAALEGILDTVFRGAGLQRAAL
eukprot:TRINITY_DN3952_c0_g1_i2.p1 TRINITY_DN3952_c0_g1~~TRINITY_DN3952_c0_g1_i2.p1  ORF type:complete len:367 (-),score=78.11 TRINITY_DN3952_c0_g1_i2:38-1138(-)